MSAELQRKKAAEQLELHHSMDANLSLGMKVAAVTLGGVVVGALTAGIGLVPYMAVVGITAVASGGAVALQYRRPMDSRLILASENMVEISQWKAALEEEITRVEMMGKPQLPAGADPDVISHILGISAAGGLGGWTRVSVIDGVRVLEQTESIDDSKCRKAQVVVRCSPINTFVVLMDVTNLHWPKYGHLRVAHTVDDHSDIIEMRCLLRSSCEKTPCKGLVASTLQFLREGLTADHLCPANASLQTSRDWLTPPRDPECVAVEGCMSRFWKLDDDGSYIIIMTTSTPEESASVEKSANPQVSACHPVGL